MHLKTIDIDKNHHKNHKKVVLWTYLAKKIDKLHFFDHFLTKIDVN